MKVILAGTYPEGTLERFSKLLPDHVVESVQTQGEYDTMTDAECIIVRILKTPASVIERNPHLKAVIRWGAGYDTVDIEAAGKRGVIVANTPGTNAYAVAELTVALMVALSRKLLGYYQNVRAGNWDRGAYSDQSHSVNQKIVGIVGAGNIGRRVASLVQAFGAQVLYYDVCRLPRQQEEEMGMAYAPLDDLLARSDILSLHLPLLDSTRHIIGAKELAAMKSTAILINTSRGSLIDELALIEALEAGHLSGAALDCVEDESSPVTSRLLAVPNVIVTPHIGGTTADLADAMIPIIAEKVKTLASSGNMTDTVNGQFLVDRG